MKAGMVSKQKFIVDNKMKKIEIKLMILAKKLVSGFSNVFQTSVRDSIQVVRSRGLHNGGFFSSAISSGVFSSRRSVNS